jgi:hypothetical protein
MPLAVTVQIAAWSLLDGTQREGKLLQGQEQLDESTLRRFCPEVGAVFRSQSGKRRHGSAVTASFRSRLKLSERAVQFERPPPSRAGSRRGCAQTRHADDGGVEQPGEQSLFRLDQPEVQPAAPWQQGESIG